MKKLFILIAVFILGNGVNAQWTQWASTNPKHYNSIVKKGSFYYFLSYKAQFTEDGTFWHEGKNFPDEVITAKNVNDKIFVAGKGGNANVSGDGYLWEEIDLFSEDHYIGDIIVGEENLLFLSFFTGCSTLVNPNTYATDTMFMPLRPLPHNYFPECGFFLNGKFYIAIDKRVGTNVPRLYKMVGLYSTSDNGDSWEEYNSFFQEFENNSLGVAYVSNGIIYMALNKGISDNPLLVKSSDEGETWESESLPNNFIPQDINVKDNDVIIVGAIEHDNGYYSGGLIENGSLLNLSSRILRCILRDSNRIIIAGDEIIYCNEATSIEEDRVANLNIYPNPCSDYLFISSNKQKEGWEKIKKVEIYNLNGQLLKQEPFKTDLKINMSDFSPGLYFLKYGSGAKKIIKK